MSLARPNLDYDWFKKKIHIKTGIDLGLYKAQQMQRRIGAMMERAHAVSYAEYYTLLEREPARLNEFLDRLTINVSELFRNPDKFQELQEKILPQLLKSSSRLKIWSAGCSYGAEPYSITMLLDEITPGAQHTLLASDVDQKILEKAENGLFNADDIKNVTPQRLQKYFIRQGELYQIRPEIRQKVRFYRHNLLADPFQSDFDLIVCRNVVIYFTDEAKDKLYRNFHHVLKPGGVLFVGGAERIFNHREIGFSVPASFFYQKEVANTEEASRWRKGF
ncbi:MAG: protein-glutamate O-methyltransferase CheR [Armatimonadetes bacterium]|nr:protein-glutamate O-methyltransferase CheR [Armatimonadota bacterium]